MSHRLPVCFRPLSFALSLSLSLAHSQAHSSRYFAGYCLLKISSLYSGVQALVANNGTSDDDRSHIRANQWSLTIYATALCRSVPNVLADMLLSSSDKNLLVSTRVVATLLGVRVAPSSTTTALVWWAPDVTMTRTDQSLVPGA